MKITQRLKNQKVYDCIKSLMYKHSVSFNKKHGSWLIRYAPQNQVVYMDNWYLEDLEIYKETWCNKYWEKELLKKGLIFSSETEAQDKLSKIKEILKQ